MLNKLSHTSQGKIMTLNHSFTGHLNSFLFVSYLENPQSWIKTSVFSGQLSLIKKIRSTIKSLLITSIFVWTFDSTVNPLYVPKQPVLLQSHGIFFIHLYHFKLTSL